MSLENFLSSIEFRLLSANTAIPTPIKRFFLNHPELRFEFEKFNSLSNEPELLKSLAPLKSIYRMSTLPIGGLINKIVSSIPDNQCYLNVGVWHGFTFFSGLLNNPMKNCIGVDNFSQFGGPKEEFLKNYNILRGPKHKFYDIDYLEYFKTLHNQEIGFYYYDGEHSYANQLKALEVAHEHMAKDCYIFVDDTNWDEPRNATFDFMRQHPDKYKLLFDLKTKHDQHFTWWNGLMVIKKIKK